MTLVKRVIEGILKFKISVIFTFQTGIFPDKKKIAKVICLCKYVNRHHLTNYKPVSLPSQSSKVFEKLFNNQLEKMIGKHELLPGSTGSDQADQNHLLSIIHQSVLISPTGG